jgi:hypothetical protein
MRETMRVPAAELKVGDFLEDEDKFVESVSHRDELVILRLSYERFGYPATSLMLQHDEMVEVLLWP